MRREARLLKVKAVSSLLRSAEAFNSLDDDGRMTSVLLHLQHSFEMLLKAALVERGLPVFDARTGRTIGFEKCLNLAHQHLQLPDESVGTLRVIDAMRDDEQHYVGCDDEQTLYLHIRAALTVFDDLLRAVFAERLGDVLPDRVLPVSTRPPESMELLVDRQFTQVRELLGPGRRRRAEARRKIRTLLALEGHVAEEVAISEKDVSRVEKAVHAGKDAAEVFPKLGLIGTTVEGTWPSIVVRLTRRAGGMPVQTLPTDQSEDAAALREVDLERMFHWTATDLAKELRLTAPQGTALRGARLRWISPASRARAPGAVDGSDIDAARD